LDVKTAHSCRLAEHLGLQLTGLIPCWLPTHRGVESKDQPPSPSCFDSWPKRFDLIEKTINFDARRRGRGRTGTIIQGCWTRRFIGPVFAHRESLDPDF
jgi:hypothetical protein